MRYEIALYDRMHCSREKKKECVKLIASVISLAEKARRMGLLVLEDDFAHLKDPFLKKGLQLVVDGTDPVLVRDILSVVMHSSNLKGVKLLKAVIILEGVLSIQSGDNPRIVADKLSAFLGKDADLWDKYWGKLSLKLEDDGVIPCTGVSIESQIITETVLLMMTPREKARSIPSWGTWLLISSPGSMTGLFRKS